MQLLAHLRKRHGNLKAMWEAHQRGNVKGAEKSVNLNRRVRPAALLKPLALSTKKETYIKRTEVTETDEQRELELVKKRWKNSKSKSNAKPDSAVNRRKL